MQMVVPAGFIDGNTLLLITIWLFVEEQVLFNKFPHHLMYLHCSYIHDLWYSWYPNL